MSSSTFTLVLNGKRFTINKTKLLTNSTFVDLHGEAFPKGSYEVQSHSPPSIFEDFIQIVEGVKPISITADNLNYFNDLGQEFGSESVSAACLTYRENNPPSSPTSFDPDTILRLSESEERLRRQEHQFAGYERLFRQLRSDIDRIISLLTNVEERVRVLEQARSHRSRRSESSSSTSRLATIFYRLSKSELHKFEVNLSDFRLEQLLGRGSWTTVYLGRDERDEQSVMVETFLRQDGAATFFDCEVAVISSFHHPTILGFRGFVPPEKCTGEYFAAVVTDYMPNGSVYDLITRASQGSLPSGFDSTNQFIIIYGVSVGMMILHSHNVIHRDLKPTNILLDDQFEPKIRDFTISEFLDPKSPINNSFFAGTILFMAPETIEQVPYGLPVDVYAFAISVYQIVTWHDPYPDVRNILRFQRNVTLGHRPSLDASVSPGYKALMEQCWHRDPNARPTFADIVRDLGSNLSRFGAIDESRFRAYQKKILPHDFK
jgi:hypothetical protein